MTLSLLGAMVAVELNRAGSGVTAGLPDPDFTKAVQAEALKRGLILLTCGVNANVVRFLFPLTIQEAVFDEAMDVLRAAMRAARS